MAQLAGTQALRASNGARSIAGELELLTAPHSTHGEPVCRLGHRWRSGRLQTANGAIDGEAGGRGGGENKSVSNMKRLL